MPDTYQPSDEQIKALADQIADYSGDERFPGAFDPYERAARTYTAWPAFQAIIRAAQAEAFRKAAGDVRADWFPDSCGWVGFLDDRADEIESADV